MSSSFIGVDQLRSRPHGGVAWLEWGAEAFERAARERKPVLLSIGASWCHGCAVMERTTYADPGIAETINARVVPVRVDADRRPDINDRYNLDGWPTTAFLTPSGEILTGSTYVTPDLMPRMIAEVTASVGERYDELMERAERAAVARRAPRMPMRYEPDRSAPEWLVEQLLAQHDPQFGGFGGNGRFLHVSPLRVALARYETTRDDRLRALLVTTFDGMGWGGIFDEVDGGFFRYASGRDWSRPHTEKMLEDQAAMVALLLDASVVLDRVSYRERALDTIAYVRRTLGDATAGGFYASQRADEEYYLLSGSIRSTLDPPVVDRTLFTDLNAQAASAWLVAADRLGDDAFARAAVQALERVLVDTYRPGEGVGHFAGGDVRGLLTDQVHAARSLLQLHAATGNDTWSMLAEELMRTALRAQWDDREGGFYDRVPGGSDEVGMLRDRQKPLALNCLAARVLARLSALTGQYDLQQAAIAALASQTGVYRSHGISAAPYALAVLEVVGD
jgi:uncharacterized protein